jgi:hypothetical protein
VPSRLKITENYSRPSAVLNDAITLPQSDPGVGPTLTSGSVRCSSSFELRRTGKLLLTILSPHNDAEGKMRAVPHHELDASGRASVGGSCGPTEALGSR